MTEKRYVIEEIGNMFRVLKDNEPLTTKFENTDKIDVINLVEELNELAEENNEFKHHIKKLEKELHLAHMRSMFSTVKSFNGDVSKRYYYSEETDRLYDTANHYGQYDKILDKKEIAMLLNEYETMLNSDLNELHEGYLNLKHKHSLLHDECTDLEVERNRLQNDVNSLEKENKELKTFKDKVFALINARIEIYKHKPFHGTSICTTLSKF